MATKAASLSAFSGAHSAGIFADMTVDGPVIGTLVVIMDRARNLPNKRTMGKQDPYCAARLGKEAKKTKTDKRGGQTPKWDQELRFTVHDSPDYHRLKISVFNDDKKTELIGETWANLEAVITPGGGQSDDWHPLNCKGKYAGEIRVEFTYYDTRPKAEKPVVEKRRESTRPDGQSPAVGGPRESMPVKRRPLPSDPTAASPSPSNTPEHRGLRGVRAGPRELGSPRHQQPPVQQRPSQQTETPTRRPLPDASPLNGTPVSSNNTPLRQQPPQPQPQDPYTPPNPRPSLTNIAQQNGQSFDMSYAAPKPYEVQPINAVPQHVREAGQRTMSQDEFQVARRQSQLPPPEPMHAHSAPVVPTQHSYELERQEQYRQYDEAQFHQPSYSQDPYQDPAYQIAPLRPSRSRDRSPGQPSPLEQYHSDDYGSLTAPYDNGASHRRRSAMQPMVEDEDDMPPPPPMHNRNASTLPHPSQESPHSYQDESPAPLHITRFQQEPPQASYSPPNPYAMEEYARQPPSERRMTYPRTAVHASSRPESRDAMAPSPLRQETSAPALPSSLIPGRDPSRDMVAYQAPPPAYETPPRLRQYSEPAEYRSATQYDDPAYSQQLVHHSSVPSYDHPYYPHDPPEQPRRTSPVHDPAPIVKPRATSPGVSPRYSPNPADDRVPRYSPNPVDDRMQRYSPNPVDDRMSRGPARSMPTRKSVSPRPPPMEDPNERRMSGVAFNPDSFDVYNPRASRSPVPRKSEEEERPGSRMEYNDKGQIVTFSGRVVDASDHLPIDNWAPEPTPKGTVKEKPIRSRAQLNGSRDIEAARQREEKYRRDREDRDRIRHAASMTFGDANEPSNALVRTRQEYSNHNSPGNSGALVLADHYSTPLDSAGRNRPQKRSPRPSYDSQQQHTSQSYVPHPDERVLRERHNPNSYGSSPSYNDRYAGAPPIPAKIPLGHGAPVQNEDMALSLELQSIDIGPGNGSRRPRAQPRRQYGF
ncbi:hypothetical protein CC86DRAFT_462907 [Ophiobolus disseminans]|uniref:C2 domain-containing protein n=1 Tax=Ophiobolus disseminans TaxID=1469910 RepID=A0A6A7AJ13_9PLEO|nr:hypothetical protein CC86DRAFT_462907 [Ophiobolus disseminans]